MGNGIRFPDSTAARLREGSRLAWRFRGGCGSSKGRKAAPSAALRGCVALPQARL